jgi:hypothetical protein
VVAEADHRDAGVIALGELTEPAEDLGLVQGGRQRVEAAMPDALRDRGGHQGVEGVVAERRQHLLLLVGARTDVAADERIGQVRHGGGSWGRAVRPSPSVVTAQRASRPPESPCARGPGA